ncbi:hypothetical protein BOTBODRAFT_143145 [Botryobasidium botryosum FD-172 SS1]|uniref:Mis12 domain-containing protein n=1 Tax=Botryobasidium botryosum (strain FD-172 SS1) TaxID=930990 RepID=A0A067N4V3_BOTB1|nr:hypothetical protein BOTBODRAFT_143145 [Botryobasidium botryosum FD-172 SS1]
MAMTVTQSTLLSEILGFPPQLLLDDLINVANESIYQAIEGLEVFLLRWAEARSAHHIRDASVDSTVAHEADLQEIDSGLHAFQTLLESHTDLALDFFEVWALRNVFAVPEGLPIVVPHQQGLDLEIPAEEERELMTEIDELRRKLENARRLQNKLELAVKYSAVRLNRAQARLSSIAMLSDIPNITTLPPAALSLYEKVREIPPPPGPGPLPSASAEAGPTERVWGESRAGYLHWAVGRLIDQTRNAGEGEAKLEELAHGVQNVAELRHVTGIVGRRNGGGHGDGDETVQEPDNTTSSA